MLSGSGTSPAPPHEGLDFEGEDEPPVEKAKRVDEVRQAFYAIHQGNPYSDGSSEFMEDFLTWKAEHAEQEDH